MRKLFLLSLALCLISGCAARKVSIHAPTLTFQTEDYVVVQSSPNNYTVLTKSKAAIDEIVKRLGCNKQHICANQWNGEVWTIQRLN